MEQRINNLLDFEQKLLALLIAETPDSSPFLNEILGFTEDIDWNRFGSLVDRHRVGALAHSGLQEFPAVTPPDHLVANLARSTSDNAENYLRSVKLSSELTQAFANADITCVILKGIGVATQYYSAPSQREMIDIDLLVDSSRYDEAEAMVRSLGFNRHYPKAGLTEQARPAFMALHNAFGFVRPADGAQIDLHWRMVQNPAMLPVIDRNWSAKLTTIEIAGKQLPILEPGLHFVYICVHGAKSGWLRLKWLADIDRAMRGLSAEDANRAADLFKSSELERIGAASLTLAKHILGTPIPPAFAEMVARQDVNKLINLQLPMIFEEMPARPHRLRDWRYFVSRFRHALMLHSGVGYRRHALLREVARPRDLETIALRPKALWTLAIISPVLGIVRAIKRLFDKQES